VERGARERQIKRGERAEKSACAKSSFYTVLLYLSTVSSCCPSQYLSFFLCMFFFFLPQFCFHTYAFSGSLIQLSAANSQLLTFCRGVLKVVDNSH
jgi:hypothetical protein